MPKDVGICKVYLDEPLALSEANALSWKGSAVSTKYCIDYLQYVKTNIGTTHKKISYEQCLEYCGMFASYYDNIKLNSIVEMLMFLEE